MTGRGRVCKTCGKPLRKGATRCWSCPAGSAFTPPSGHSSRTGCGGVAWFLLIAVGLAVTLGVKMVGDTPAYEERDSSVIVPFFLVLIVVVVVGLLLLRLVLRGVGSAASGAARAMGAGEGVAQTVGQVTRIAAGVAVAGAVFDGVDDAGGGDAPEVQPEPDAEWASPAVGGGVVAELASPPNAGLADLDLDDSLGDADLGAVTAAAALPPLSDAPMTPLAPPPAPPPPPLLESPALEYPEIREPPLEQPLPPEAGAPGMRGPELMQGGVWPHESGYVFLYEQTVRDPAGVALGNVPVIVPQGVPGQGLLDMERLVLEFQSQHGCHAKPSALRMGLDGTWALLPPS